MIADTLVVIGLATISLGTIQEADGVQERTFWLRNDGSETVTLQQGYTSCGCTTIDFARGSSVEPGDSTCVTLRFNPRGKGGEFMETGTLVYGDSRKRVELSMVGNCITSEETLQRQFPVRVSDRLRLSANRFDLGIMRVGESKERNVIVLHKADNNRQERFTVSFSPDADTPKGLQHIVRTISTDDGGQRRELKITFDVIVK